VVAPDALGADVWATALSVLGEAGLSRLPPGHEALLVDQSEMDGLIPCTQTQQVGTAALQPH